MRHNDVVYAIKNENVDRENKKLNRNAYNASTCLLGNTCYKLQNQTFTTQNFHFSVSSIF